MRKLIISLAASAVITAGVVAGLQASAQASDNGRLEATFTARPVSVTPNLGMVELIVSGTGTVQGFGTATEVVGVVEDQAASPCGAGGASDSAERRIVMQGGLFAALSSSLTRSAPGMGPSPGCQASGERSISVPETVPWPVVGSTVTLPVPRAPAKIPVLACPSTW